MSKRRTCRRILCAAIWLAASAWSPCPTLAAEGPAGVVSRRLRVDGDAVADIHARIGFTTFIELPASERVLRVTVGNSEIWLIEAAENGVHIKPVKAGATTNANVLTETGTIFTFLLREVSAEPSVATDLKVLIQTAASELSPERVGRRFVSVEELQACRAVIEDAEQAAERRASEAESRFEKARDEFRASYPIQLDFNYEFELRKKPFGVEAVFTDGKHTFIQASPEELPSLFEVKDGKVALTSSRYDQGTYIVGKVLGDAVLAIGKKSLYIKRIGK